MRPGRDDAESQNLHERTINDQREQRRLHALQAARRLPLTVQIDCPRPFQLTAVPYEQQLHKVVVSLAFRHG